MSAALLAVGGAFCFVVAERATRAEREPGVSVALVVNGATKCASSRGWADRGRGSAVTSDTRFELASVTKLFTALVVLRLVEREQLALDDTVAQHVAGLPPWSIDVRVRHLLTHCDGLPDDVSPDRLAAVNELAFPPGSRCVYGDSGFRLLARIVEIVTKKSFGDVLRDEFFVPLKMTRTVVDDGRDLTLDRGAVGYRHGWLRDAPIDKNQFETTSGDSGVLSAVNDLAKFAAALDDPSFLPPASRELAFSRAPLADGAATGLASFGCGFAIGTIAGRRCARHTGGWAGFRTLFAYLPDDHASVIVLANVDDFDVDGEAKNVVERELGER